MKHIYRPSVISKSPHIPTRAPKTFIFKGSFTHILGAWNLKPSCFMVFWGPVRYTHAKLSFHFWMIIGPCNLWMNHPSYTTLSSDPRWIPHYYSTSTNQAEANQIIRNCSSLFKIDFLNTSNCCFFYIISSILGMTSVFFCKDPKWSIHISLAFIVGIVGLPDFNFAPLLLQQGRGCRIRHLHRSVAIRRMMDGCWQL